MMGDSPLAKTGFGRVNRMALEAFLERDWEVASVTGLQHEEVETELPIRQFCPPVGDNLGITLVGKSIEEFQPDVVYMTCDPGTAAGFSIVIPEGQPWVAYVPIEGEPIVAPEMQHVLSKGNVFTCSEYGAGIVKRDLNREIPWVWHGVDHEAFYPDPERRETVRTRLGWQGKFVVMTVAANVRRKQHPRLFEAISLLKHKYHRDDIILYDHTQVFANHWLEGWDLDAIGTAFQVKEQVFFNARLNGWGKGISDRPDGDDIGLADLYRAADLFVLPSQVEGFGLPIAEAMASGLPVLVTRYAAGWEVAKRGDGASIPIRDWEIAKNGTKYANVDPEGLAKEILRLARNPKRLAAMSAKGIEGAQAFQWRPMQEMAIGLVEAAASEHQEAAEDPQGLVQVDREPGEEGQGAGTLQEASDTRREGQEEEDDIEGYAPAQHQGQGQEAGSHRPPEPQATYSQEAEVAWP